MRCSCNVQHRQACECMPIPSFQGSSPGFCGRYPLAHAKQRSARLLVSFITPLDFTAGPSDILFSNFLNLHLVSFCSHSSTTQDPQDCARKENSISWASPECQGRRLNTTGGLIPGGSGKIQDGLFLRALDASDGALDVQVAYWRRRRHSSPRQDYWISPEELDEAWKRSARKVRREERLKKAVAGSSVIRRTRGGRSWAGVPAIGAPTSPGKFGNRIRSK